MANINYDTRLESVLSLGKYQAKRTIPIVENPYPEDPIAAILKIKNILPGMDFEIIGSDYIEHLKRAYKERDKKGNPIGRWLYRDTQKRWYKVKAKIAGKEISGYINEIALLGKSIKKY